jgi:hypothetical protein
MRSIIAAILSLCLLATSTLGAERKGSRERGNAFLKSLVVPGWGQLSSGHKSTATLFALSELTLLGTMYASHYRGVAKRTDYKAYAAQYAGVVGSHPHDFYVDVGNWENVDGYNEQRLKDREFDQLYTDASDRWQWDSNEHRVRMKKIRVQSDEAFNAIYYLVGGLILNHIASAIHAGRTARIPADQSSAVPNWHLSVSPTTGTRGVALRFSYLF